MITFLELGQYGRLGNQLFQYAALKSLSLSKGYQIKLPKNLYERSWHSQKCLLSKFNITFESLEDRDIYNLKTYDQYQVTGSAQSFDPNFFELDDNTNLAGYYQNLKYFHHHSDLIKNDFKLNDEIQKKSKDYLKNKIGHTKPIVSVHIRRGDYAPHSDQNLIKTHIEKCISFFNDEVNFLLFTGGSTGVGENNIDDVQYLKDNYLKNNFYYSETNNPIMDFCLMSKCDHNIISHGSTFSWWAAYLNENKDKKVFAPKNPDSVDQSVVYDCFYPDDWILV